MIDPDPPRIGHRILSFDSIGSTNTLAAAHASNLANHGLVITAASQTAGRGQYRRAWQAPPGSSVLMSVLLFPPPEIRRPVILTAWAAVSVGDVISQLTGLPTQIKWPNDLLIDGKKACGILCEGGADYVVAGIGLNVNQAAADFERMGLPEATSLSACTGQSFDVPDLVPRIVSQLDAAYSSLTRGDLCRLETAWKDRFGLLNKVIVAEMMDGSEMHARLNGMSFSTIELIAEIGSSISIVPETIRHLRIRHVS